jgi:hypothetical protein
MWDESAWQAVVEQSDAFEFDWYGIDRTGHVAAFSSYGRGVIPSVVKTFRESYNALYELIAALPDSAQAELVYKGNGQYDDWLAYSRRGLYGYDYQDAHRAIPLGQYDLLTVPATSIHVTDLKLVDELHRIMPRIDVVFGADPVLPFALFPH